MNTKEYPPKAQARAESRQEHTTALEAKVAAHNRTHAEINRLAPLMREAFRPFIGKKVLTHGGVVAKLKTEIDKLTEDSRACGFRVWRDGGNYSVYYYVDCTEQIEGRGCVYGKGSFYVCEVEGYDCKKLIEDGKPLRTDYTAEEIRNKRKLAEKLADEARTAEYALTPFGKYDQ